METFRADLLQKDKTKTNKKRRFWLILLGVLAFLVLFGLVAGERYFFHDAPKLPADLNELWTVDKHSSFVLLDKNGVQLARRGPYYGRPIPVEQMPEHLVQAFLAMEDKRFYQHNGVDKKGVARAAWVNWRGGRTKQGGSTITQQLVKMLLLTPDRTIRRKLQEMRLAQTLEKRWSKDEILGLYLNRIYLGNRAYGVDAAAKRYFQKEVAELSLSETAMLAALPKAPSKFAPHLHPEEAQTRANLVLDAMFDAGFISDEVRQTAKAEPAAASPNIEIADHGYIFDLAVQRAKQITGGRITNLIITTTIDPDLQELADTSLRQFIKKKRPAAQSQPSSFG